MKSLWLVLLSLTLYVTFSGHTFGQQKTAQVPEGKSVAVPQEPTVAAVVNDEEITVEQIERDLAKTIGDIKLTADQKLMAQRASLEKLIDQRVAFEFLKKHKHTIGENEVHLRIEELKT